ncbi:MAG: hypothetical protein GWM92_00250 [Gemmatimonadetes bacterium]|nr:hypothetical protein [Gemmatimonadota bacterium]NIR76868.1 hypothetical protein [Gemmatimonadota bacterium]NIT85390.1 hypothetical protein [Gemmatimonadota bacterium]NIU29208.1 hypothetical protein [Gemmatimonadota bacterium]NIU34305.1 hypothetical protein [Gemmatimonadota bacterium]
MVGNGRLPLGIDAALKGIYASARPYTAIDSVDHNGDGFLNDRPPGEGRNARRGPDFFRVDLGLSRGLRFRGSEAAIELNVYNLLNRTNLNPSSARWWRTGGPRSSAAPRRRSRSDRRKSAFASGTDEPGLPGDPAAPVSTSIPAWRGG